MKARIPFRPSNRQRAAMEEEIDRQLAVNARRMNADLCAVFLWSLRESEGWEKEKLTEKAEHFLDGVERLAHHYEMHEEDASWLCKHLLKAMGVDVDKIAEGKFVQWEGKG